MNHETEDDTCLSALEATRQNCGHCVEGAMLGAYILSLHGHPPYLCDVRFSLSLSLSLSLSVSLSRLGQQKLLKSLWFSWDRLDLAQPRLL